MHLVGERERDDGVDSCDGKALSAALWSPDNFRGIPLDWAASRYLCLMASCSMGSPAPHLKASVVPSGAPEKVFVWASRVPS
jgi:hypothetical protein